jgi:hypothetical protein
MLTVFERFEVVWPLDVAVMIKRPKSDGKE